MTSSFSVIGHQVNDPPCFRFGEFALQVGRRALTRDGIPVDLGSRATDVLLALLRRPGEVAAKATIMREVWPGMLVAENNLTTQMAQVRRALGDPDGRRFIQTVPGRGYRFIAEVIRDSAAASPPTPPPDRHGLPLESSSFIGRERELADIAARLTERRLVTVVGAGGVGKTRTALKVAADHVAFYPDGVLLLELAPLSDPELVAELLCRKLGVAPGPTRNPNDAAVSVLHSRRLLLVLDNCEHVLGAAAALAGAILRHCRLVRVLATSQEALRVPGEMVYRLPALGVPPGNGSLTAALALQSEAVQLFTERAADALGSYILTDADAPAVATICRRLEGVPLAKELAAARLRMLNPREIAARLENMFRLLNVGSRTAMPRHQTLHATIDWSFALLSPPEQVVLRRLSVFVDGCCLDGAIAVASGDGIAAHAVFDLLTTLVGRSLVVADTTRPTTRYRMLETTRQYAAEKLAEAGEAGRRLQMAEFLLALFRRAEAVWPTVPTDAWLATYGVEAENFRAAIDWAFAAGEPALGVSLVAQSGALAEERSLQPDLRRWTAAAMPHVTAETPRVEAAAILYLRTMLEKRLGAYAVPVDRRQAIALFRAAGEQVGLSRALRQTAMARAMPGPMDPDVLAMATEAVDLLRDLAPHKDLATALAHLGSVHFLAGDHATSRLLNEQALAMRRRLGDRTGMLASSVNLAELAFLDGDVGGALRYAAQAEVEARRGNVLATLALILSNLAGYRLANDQVVGGTQAASEALGLSRAIGQDYLAVMCLEHLALSQALRGALEPAAHLLGYTDAHYQEGGQTRERLEQLGFERLERTLLASLAPERLAALRSIGAGWTAPMADAAALGV
jgi:predicted ATPase/DNA-binding winged helix-turn-helix (wHTH) protein